MVRILLKEDPCTLLVVQNFYRHKNSPGYFGSNAYSPQCFQNGLCALYAFFFDIGRPLVVFISVFILPGGLQPSRLSAAGICSVF